MKILVDLDGVIFQTYEVVGSLYKEKFNKELDWDKVKDGNKFWDSKYGKFLVECFEDYELNANLPIREDAPKVLQALIKKHKIFYCTARRPINFGATHDSFKKYGIPFSDINFIMRNGDIPFKKQRNAVGCQADLAIDDEWENVVALAEVCPVIYFKKEGADICLKYKYPIIRADNWKQIKKILL